LKELTAEYAKGRSERRTGVGVSAYRCDGERRARNAVIARSNEAGENDVAILGEVKLLFNRKCKVL
jgi:hypothetical protein